MGVARVLRRPHVTAPDGLAGGPDIVAPKASPRRRPPASGIASQVLEYLPMAVMVMDQGLRLRHWNRQAMVLLGAPSFLAEAAPPLTDLLARAEGLTPRQRRTIEAFCRDQVPGTGLDADSCLSLPHGRDSRLLLRLRGIGRNRWLLVVDDALPPYVQEGPETALDALTGLTNARGLRQALADAADLADSGEAFCLLLVDLDRFAAVNDSFGREVGDAVLCLAAKRMKREVRSADLVARHGGDSFAVLARDAAATGALATRLVHVLGLPFQTNGQTVSLTATAGLASIPCDAGAAAALLDRAEAVLAEAKHRTRGSWLDDTNVPAEATP